MNTIITVVCQVCKTEHKIIVPVEDLKKWSNGMFVQDAFPYLSPGTRELLISHTCEPCFDKTFEEEIFEFESPKDIFMFKPDWSAIYSINEIEHEFQVKFVGPGLYSWKEDYLVVVPIDRPNNQLWNQEYNQQEKFECNVYNQRNPIEWFNLMVKIPLRITIPIINK